ncbi:MAG TPA: hypothetical protein VMZ26_16355 [Pyrinomonadaceae bacterium]|nr:hypothetical protein [Pyrinomonadaceae bacterium]
MSEATEKKQIEINASELGQPRWSVVSFDACEASGLTYSDAVKLLSEKEAAGVYGLCIVTDEAAHRIKS